MVLGFACTAGATVGVSTELYMDPLQLDCSDPYGAAGFGADVSVDPSPTPAGNLCAAGAVSGCAAVTEAPGVDADAYLYQVAAYRGEEALTSGGVAAQKVYWNVALGVNDVHGCRLRTRATADDAADPGDQLVAGTVAAGAVYPYVQWDVNLATCASEQLTFGDPSASVTTAYTAVGSGGYAFTYYYLPGTGAGAFCTPVCANGGACVSGICQCVPGFSGPGCQTADAPLALTESAATLPINGTHTFIATGGTGARTFSVASGAGTIAAISGLYTAPGTMGTAVVRVTDSLGHIAEATVTISCADLTVTTNTTLQPGSYCYGTLRVTNNAVLTFAGNGTTGAGVTVNAQNVVVNAGASISANAQGYAAGTGPGAGSGHTSTATNQIGRAHV